MIENLTKEKDKMKIWLLKKIYSLKVYKMLKEKLDELEEEEFKDREDISLLKDNVHLLIYSIIDLITNQVDLVLKEIEKEIWKHEKTAESFLNDGNTRAKELHAGISEGLEIAKDLIKKAFSGVVDDD